MAGIDKIVPCPCGWLEVRYGRSWQITPTILVEQLSDPDQEKAQRAMTAALQMKTIDINAILRACAG